MTTPNMALTLPVVSQTPGPTWASEINADLSLIDSHNHTSGNGALVPVAGLDINADLSLDTHALTDVTKVVLLNGASATNNSVYAVAGNLWWTNGGGTPVQITSGNAVNVGMTGNIGGMTGSSEVNYVSAQLAYEFIDENGNPAGLNAAAIACDSVQASSFLRVDSILLTAPTGASSYTLELPSNVPANSSFLTVDASGACGYVSENQGITKTMLAAVGEEVSTYTSSTVLSIGNVLLPITITTTGRPIFVGFLNAVGDAVANEILLENTTDPSWISARVAVNITSASPIPGFTAGYYLKNSISGYVLDNMSPFRIPASSINGIVVLPAGTYTLQTELRYLNASAGTARFSMIGSLFAYEL
jgi:hypothetical protein